MWENCGGRITEQWISIRIIWVLDLVHYPVLWTEHISETGSVPVLTSKGDNITIWLCLTKTPNASHWKRYILVSRCLRHHKNSVPAPVHLKLVPSNSTDSNLFSCCFDDICTSSNAVLQLMLANTTYGAHGGADASGTALQAGRLLVWFLMLPMEFLIDTILPAALWSWGWLSR